MSILRRIFEALRDFYEDKPGYPWWSDDPIEVVIGAVLVQGSTWTSVEKAMAGLRAQKLIDFHKMAGKTDEELAEIIRPVGFQTKKSQRLKAVARLILEQSGGDITRYFARDAEMIRRELLGISGIGAGTADNILLYAGQLPIYMTDTFTIRILHRHGIAPPHAGESQIQQLIHQELTPDEEPYGAKLFQKMQEYLVRTGREFCDKSRPDCAHCPLKIYLPESGRVPMGEPAKKQHAAKTRHNAAPPSAKMPEKSPPKPISPPAEELELNETERKIVSVIGEEPMPIDTVIQLSGLPVHIVRATIAVLQMKKVVRQTGGNQVERFE